MEKEEIVMTSPRVPASASEGGPPMLGGRRIRPWRLCLLAVIAVALGALLAPGSGSACTGTCASPCGGFCTIQGSSCATSCYGGHCPGNVTCQEIGTPGNPDCAYEKTVECKAGCPDCPPCPSCGPPIKTGEWAAIDYVADPVGARQVTVLGASSPKFAATAVEELMSAPVPRTGGDADAERSSRRPPQSRIHFRLSPTGDCTRLELDFVGLDEVRLPAADSRRAALFWVLTGQEGRIADAVQLFTEVPEHTDELTWVLFDKARITSGDADETYGAYVVFKVSQDGTLSYLFSGGSKLLPE
jgi:hypothetical protein